MLCQLLWKKGLRILFGPIYHKLYTNAKILEKPKLGHLETFFTWIFISCRDMEMKKLLDNLIESSRDNNRKILLKNIRYLLQIVLPFVCF